MVTLADVADTALGKMLDKTRPKGSITVPYLRNVNVQWGRINTHDVLTVDLSEDERDRFALVPGDLLVCEGGDIGRAAIWHGGHEYMAFQKALHRVRSRGDVDLRWLRYLLEHYALKGVLAERATGSTILHLPQQQLRRLPVPLPPLAEQRRIVDILEDHLSRLDAANTYLSRARVRQARLVDRYLSSNLAAIGPPVRPLGDVLSEPLINGRSVPTADAGFPVLRLTALQEGRIDLAARKTGAWTATEAAPFLVRHRDFLISRGNGSRRLVGRGGLVAAEPDPVAFPDTLIRIRTQADRVHPEFLALVWNGSDVRQQIEAAAKTTAGIYKINQKDVQRVVLPMPTMEQQVSLASQVSAFQESVERLADAQVASAARIQALRRALLASAFSGRLMR